MRKIPEEWKNWQQLDHDNFFDLLERLYPRSTRDAKSSMSAQQQLLKHEYKVPEFNQTGMAKWIMTWRSLERDYRTERINEGEAELENGLLAIAKKHMEDIIKKGLNKHRGPEIYYAEELQKVKSTIQSFTDYTNALLKISVQLQDIYATARRLSWVPTYKPVDKTHPYTDDYHGHFSDSASSSSENEKGQRQKKRKHEHSHSVEKSTRSSSESSAKSSPKHETKRVKFEDRRGKVCTGCGRENSHELHQCNLHAHPDFNSDPNIKWGDTAVGKRYKKFGQKFLNRDTTIDQLEKGIKKSSSKEVKNKSSNSQGGKRLNTLHDDNSNDDLLSVVLYASDDASQTFTKCLLDTGSLHSCYISKEAAQWLTLHKTKQCSCHPNDNTYGPNKSICYLCLGRINNLSVEFFNEQSNSNEIVKLNAIIIDMDFDLIIGRPTIKKYNLTHKLASHFHDPQVVEDVLNTRVSVVDASYLASLNQVFTNNEMEKENVTEISKEDWLGVTGQQEDYIKDQETIHDMLMQNNTIPLTDKIIVDGLEIPIMTAEELLKHVTIGQTDPIFYENIKQIILEFRDIFSLGLRQVPADVPPMQIEVDITAWLASKSQRKPRKYTETQRKELEQQISDLLEAGIIRETDSDETSPSFYVPKPDGTQRFVIDFRKLNEATTKLGWPLPNIKIVLERIGSYKPKYFAVVDLTKGYYQTLMDDACRKYTATSTPLGNYEWNRTPMGLSGAPSYFQRQLATIVLKGLIRHILELYIDDVIIHANQQQQFIRHLRMTFERFRKYRVTLNPKKCKFGITEVNYLGHVLNSHGVTMSDERRQKVIDFPVPKVAKELKSFLGVVNFFRDHVKNHSCKVRKLHDMIRDYKKSRKLNWTEEALQEFYDMKRLVAECPQLYFVDDELPIYVHTDASDYGVGAYVFQEDPSRKQIPIRFLSKALTDEQLRWSTPEKETYAIFWTLMELDYLLRDRFFIIRTDHSNLQYINQNPTSKVTRWKLAIQEFQFKLQHIAGKDNILADRFSRIPAVEIDTEDIDTEVKPRNLHRTLLALSEKVFLDVQHGNFIKKFHNAWVGHMGVELTISRINNYFDLQKFGTVRPDEIVQPWPKMRQHVQTFIKHCPTCQKLSQINPQIKTKPYTVATYSTPMDELNVDTMGPFPVVDGFQHILVVICRSSRFINLYPLQSVEAQEAALKLIHHFSLFKTPKTIRSDGGSQFVNELITQLLSIYKVEHDVTLAYSKEENAIVERANKEVLRHLRAFMLEPVVSNKWPDYLPMIQRIINTTTHGTLQFTPAQIIFGYRFDKAAHGFCVPIQNVKNIDEVPSQVNIVKNKHWKNWLEQMQTVQAKIMEVAMKNQQTADNLNLERRAQDEYTTFPVDSYVLVRYPKTAIGRKGPTKLHSPWKGPMKVVKAFGNEYTILNLVTLKEEKVHITSLKPFKWDARQTNPREVALREAGSYDIEQVLAHRCKNKDKISSYEFKIRWSGYTEQDDTWEPWRGVMQTEAIHNYLRANGLKRFIPPRFKS